MEKIREEPKNITHIGIGKDKGRTEKHYPYSYRERQGKNRETKAIFIEGKTREELKNITHFCIGKDKGRIEKNYPYLHRERQGKNRETKAIFIKERQGKN